MKLLNKKLPKLLAVLSLGILFTTNAFAEQVKIDQNEMLKIINRYWDICEQVKASKITRAQADIEVGKMSKRPDLADITLGACFSRMNKAEKDNKERGKGQWDMSKSVKLVGISKTNQTIIAYYTYYAWQDDNYKFPKGVGKSYTGPYRMDFVLRKNPDGTIKYLIQ